MEPTLYSSPDSYDSFVMRWIATEKQCPIDYRTVYSFEVALDTLPNFQDRDLYLIDHESMVQYLQERYPGEPLLPSDPKIRAQIRQICSMIRSNGLDIISDVNGLLATGGPYITGDEFTLADIYIGARLHQLQLEGNAAAPRVAAYYKQLAGRQAFKDSME